MEPWFPSLGTGALLVSFSLTLPLVPWTLHFTQHIFKRTEAAFLPSLYLPWFVLLNPFPWTYPPQLGCWSPLGLGKQWSPPVPPNSPWHWDMGSNRGSYTSSWVFEVLRAHGCSCLSGELSSPGVWPVCRFWCSLPVADTLSATVSSSSSAETAAVLKTWRWFNWNSGFKVIWSSFCGYLLGLSTQSLSKFPFGKPGVILEYCY